MTKPYICKGDDGTTYFVKGENAGKAALVKEFIAASLCCEIGLPVAPFEIAKVPDLEDDGMTGSVGLHSLGCSQVFASKYCPGNEFQFLNIPEVDSQTQLKLYFFDRWIKNPDRILTEKGGNPIQTRFN